MFRTCCLNTFWAFFQLYGSNFWKKNLQICRHNFTMQIQQNITTLHPSFTMQINRILQKINKGIWWLIGVYKIPYSTHCAPVRFCIWCISLVFCFVFVFVNYIICIDSCICVQCVSFLLFEWEKYFLLPCYIQKSDIYCVSAANVMARFNWRASSNGVYFCENEVSSWIRVLEIHEM